MKKALQQITFEFEAPAEEPQVQTTPVPAPTNTAPTPPLIIEIMDDEEETVTVAEENTTSVVTLPDTGTAETENEANPPITTPTDSSSVIPKRISSTRGRKSLKETAITADLIQVPEDEVLFSKQYYSIGEVATMFRENQSLIRYWETEFDILQPKKNKKGDRYFRPVDVKNLVLIYDLLRRRKFTIEGAKDFLKRNKKAEDKFAMIQSLEKIKLFLLELRSNL